MLYAPRMQARPAYIAWLYVCAHHSHLIPHLVSCDGLGLAVIYHWRGGTHRGTLEAGSVGLCTSTSTGTGAGLSCPRQSRPIDRRLLTCAPIMRTDRATSPFQHRASQVFHKNFKNKVLHNWHSIARPNGKASRRAPGPRPSLAQPVVANQRSRGRCRCSRHHSLIASDRNHKWRVRLWGKVEAGRHALPLLLDSRANCSPLRFRRFTTPHQTLTTRNLTEIEKAHSRS
jgi:hypothetical protein